MQQIKKRRLEDKFGSDESVIAAGTQMKGTLSGIESVSGFPAIRRVRLSGIPRPWRSSTPTARIANGCCMIGPCEGTTISIGSGS